MGVSEKGAYDALAALIQEHETSLNLHSMKKSPPREFEALIKKYGAAVIRKRVKKKR